MSDIPALLEEIRAIKEKSAIPLEPIIKAQFSCALANTMAEEEQVLRGELDCWLCEKGTMHWVTLAHRHTFTISCSNPECTLGFHADGDHRTDPICPKTEGDDSSGE